MPMNNLFPSPTAQRLGSDLGFGGGLLDEERQNLTEEEKRRRRLGLSPASDQSPTTRALLGGLSSMSGPNFNLGGIR